MDMMPAPVCFKSSDSSSSNCPLDQTSNQMVVSVDITNAIGFSKERVAIMHYVIVYP